MLLTDERSSLLYLGQVTHRFTSSFVSLTVGRLDQLLEVSDVILDTLNLGLLAAIFDIVLLVAKLESWQVIIAYLLRSLYISLSQVAYEFRWLAAVITGHAAPLHVSSLIVILLQHLLGGRSFGFLFQFRNVWLELQCFTATLLFLHNIRRPSTRCNIRRSLPLFFGLLEWSSLHFLERVCERFCLWRRLHYLLWFLYRCRLSIAVREDTSIALLAHAFREKLAGRFSSWLVLLGLHLASYCALKLTLHVLHHLFFFIFIHSHGV